MAWNVLECQDGMTWGQTSEDKTREEKWADMENHGSRRNHGARGNKESGELDNQKEIMRRR